LEVERKLILSEPDVAEVQPAGFRFEAEADYQTLNPRPWSEPGKLG
jgi:hypothetical protein